MIRTHEARHNQFLFQNVQNEIFEVFKIFKNNMKFIRAAYWINSKISNRQQQPSRGVLIKKVFWKYAVKEDTHADVWFQ